MPTVPAQFRSQQRSSLDRSALTLTCNASVPLQQKHLKRAALLAITLGAFIHSRICGVVPQRYLELKRG